MEISRLKRVNHQLNRLYGAADMVFSRKPVESSPEPVFIVSPPRSGSTLLYQLMLNHFPLEYLSNLHQYFYGAARLVAILENRFSKKPIPYRSRYGRIDGLFAPTEYYGIWYRLFRGSIERGEIVGFSDLDPGAVRHTQALVRDLSAIKSSALVFKCLYLSLCTEALAEVFPGSKFVRIRRNEMDTAYSVYEKLATMNRTQRISWSVGFPGRSEFDEQDPAIQSSAQVISLSGIISRQCTGLGSERLLEIDYRDLCSDPRGTVEKLSVFLQLPGGTSYLEGINCSEKVIPKEFAEQFNRTRKLLEAG